MVFGLSPVGRFIARAHIDRNLIKGELLYQEIENLIDIIIARLESKSIEEVAQTLLPNIFSLRLSVLDELSEREYSITDYTKHVQEEINVNALMSPLSKVADQVSISLNAYFNVIEGLIKVLPSHNFSDLSKIVSEIKLSYQFIEFVLLHPSPQIRFIKNLVDESLKFEVGLIVADLFLANKLALDKKSQENLIDFLDKTTVRFGGYAIFTGFWKPNDDDLSDITNRMNILTSVLYADHGNTLEMNKQELHQLFEN